MNSRTSGGKVPRVTPGSMGSGRAPAARGPWESSGTQGQCAEDAATASAASVVWEQQTGSVLCAMSTGRESPKHTAINDCLCEQRAPQ